MPQCVGNPDAHSAVDAPYTRPFPLDCTSPRHLGDDAKSDTGDTKYNKNLHSLGSPGTFVGSYTAKARYGTGLRRITHLSKGRF
jgi:hypothetical protein